MKFPAHFARCFASKARKAPEQSGIFKKLVDNIKSSSNDSELKTSLQQFEEKLTEIKELEGIKRAKEIVSQVKAQNEAVFNEVQDKIKVFRETTGAAASKIGDTMATVAKPIRDVGDKLKDYVPDLGESELAKKVSKTVSEAESRIIENSNVYQYGGFKPKAERAKMQKAMGQSTSTASPSADPETVSENPSAGSSVVPAKQSHWSKLWGDFKDSNRVLNRLHEWRRAYDESNNVFVYFTRELTDRVTGKFASIFAENDTARAMRELKLRDPNFSMERFMKTVREYIVPEILDAFLTADLPSLKNWCSEAAYNVLKSSFEAQLKPGVVFAGRVLDLRNLEMVTAKVLDDRPVLVFSFNTQQISVVKDSKGAVLEGNENAIDNITYVMALAKSDVPQASDKMTGGWKLVEIAIRDRNGAW